MEKAYGDIRALDSRQNSESNDPVEAIRRIIDVTFDYDETHPNFISLVTVENIHRGRNIEQLPSIKERNASVIRTLSAIVDRGAKAGQFRADVNPVDLHLLISALCVFRVSNRFTFGKIFGIDLSDAKIRKRQKKMILEAVLRYLAP